MDSTLKVFIVDDDADDIEIFEEATAEISPRIRCESARDPKDAWQKLTDQLPSLPDLIFLDLNMPKMNGKTFLGKLKSSEEFAGIPVIMYSTSSFQRDIEESKELGAVHFLTKPSRYTELRNTLSVLLKEYGPLIE